MGETCIAGYSIFGVVDVLVLCLPPKLRRIHSLIYRLSLAWRFLPRNSGNIDGSLVKTINLNRG